jgi:hypothetical protein
MYQPILTFSHTDLHIKGCLSRIFHEVVLHQMQGAVRDAVVLLAKSTLPQAVCNTAGGVKPLRPKGDKLQLLNIVKKSNFTQTF